MIELDTSEIPKGKRDRASHFWSFEGRVPNGIHFRYETDGPLAHAKKRALARFRKLFGRQAQIKVTVR